MASQVGFVAMVISREPRISEKVSRQVLGTCRAVAIGEHSTSAMDGLNVGHGWSKAVPCISGSGVGVGNDAGIGMSGCAGGCLGFLFFEQKVHVVPYRLSVDTGCK